MTALYSFRIPAVLAAALLFQACGTKGGIDAKAGERAFVSRCASCHQVGPYARGGFAPQLNGIVGRKTGATPDFRYSRAMKNASLVWDERTLAAFIRDPQAVVPGTTMRFRGVSDDAQVASLVTYLGTNK